MEHKLLNLQKTEFKFGNEGSLQFTGYASVFGGVDSYGDMIMKGAYSNTLTDRERPVQLRWNHFGPVIGKYVDIYEDEIGLVVSGELTKGHSVAEDTAALLRHGAVSGLSIGYIAKNATQDGVIRKLTEIDLFEVSVVEEPADNAAHISGIKSALSECHSLKEIELVLKRQNGLSQSMSTAIVSAVKGVIQHGDRANATLDALKTVKFKY
jgi:HK97 family phage prohead protease